MQKVRSQVQEAEMGFLRHETAQQSVRTLWNS